MAIQREAYHRKHSIIEVGKTAPANFKFGIIVALAVFWAQFFQSLLEAIFSFLGIPGVIVADLLTAILASVLGYLVLLSYRKIRFRLKKIKM